MQDGFDRNRIIGSLKHGVVSDSFKSLTIVATAAVTFGSTCAGIGVILLAVYTAQGKVNWGICVIAVLAIAIVLSLILYCYFRWRRKIKGIKAELELWLQDAVMLKAYSTKIKETNTAIYDIFSDAPPEYKISVGFKYNGIHYKYKSGVDNCWKRFLDKEIDILYSPNYRQVILLKP